MRDQILREIRQYVAKNGEPPGMRTFVTETGITEKHWKGVLWARWGDAIAELRIYSKTVEGFPNYQTLTRRFGTIAGVRSAARVWAGENPDYLDVADLIPDQSPSMEDQHADGKDGWVYLLQSGQHFKIGQSGNLEQRIKKIATALPVEVVLEHAIKTDDPSGIEAYWHRRFADKRLNGEWFALTTSDVKAFKKRKFQ